MIDEVLSSRSLRKVEFYKPFLFLETSYDPELIEMLKSLGAMWNPDVRRWILYLPDAYVEDVGSAKVRVDVKRNEKGYSITVLTSYKGKEVRVPLPYDFVRKWRYHSYLNPEEAVDFLDELISTLKRDGATIIVQKMRIEDPDRGICVDVGEDGVKRVSFEGSLEGLWKHQRDIIDRLLRGNLLLAWDMGTGKTVVALKALDILHKRSELNHALILTPASLKLQWYREAEVWCSAPTFLVERRGRESVEREWREKGGVLIANYELIQRDPLLLEPVDVLVLDECQRVKNWSAKTTKLVKKIKAKKVWGLSGTPLENRLTELYTIMSRIAPSLLPRFSEFMERYVIRETMYLGDRTVRVIKGYKNVDEFVERISPAMSRVKRSEVLDLPPLTDQPIFIPLSDDERSIYKELDREFLDALYRYSSERSRELKENVLTKFLRLREFSDDPRLLGMNMRGSKIKELLEVMEGILEQEGSFLLVFSEFERMVNIIGGELDMKGIKYGIISGEVSLKRRQEVIDNFNEGKIRVILSTDAGAYGLNLQRANYVINYDLPWNPAKASQRASRAYRAGQKRSVSVSSLIINEGVELRILDTIYGKSSMILKILDGTEVKEIADPFELLMSGYKKEGEEVQVPS
ncbi:MAG: DEAD/DEAH box helicase [Candidatus Korarchaeum sp.]